MAEKILDFDSSWIRGSNSSMEPGMLPLGSTWQMVNMICIAGVLSCRPGYRCIVQLPTGNLQGASIFRPQLGLEQMLVAVDGVIYASPWPFNDFKILPNVLFSSSAKQIFWTQATQSNQSNSDGSIEVISPREVLFMQDGGFTAPAYYDGSQSGHIRDIPFQTPAGSSMEWIGDRLWVATGNKLRASDIGNPFSFRETIYLGGSDFFSFPSDITGMVSTPSLEFPQLVIFTDNTASLIEASLRTRSEWPTTNGFQREILQVGCASDRAVVSHFGRLVWFSPAGITFYDPATSRGWTSRTPIRDNEMLTDKSRLHSDLSLAAAGVFGQWLLMSLPYEDLFNKQTWILNNASWETVNDEGGPTWNGHWLGTRPVEWVYGVIAGEERIFHVSADEDGVNRLWQCFTPDRLDNGCPITWAMFSRGYFGLSGQSKKPAGAPCRFGWAETAFAGVEEDCDIGFFVAPGCRGEFKQILSRRISVEKGSLKFDKVIDADTILYGFKAQSRKLRSQDMNQNSDVEETGDCPVESDRSDNIDESFQLLIVGQGPATTRYIRTLGFLEPDTFEGAANACENETPFNAIRYDGAGARADTYEKVATELASRPTTHYTSNRTVTIEQDGFVAVGVGSAESIISQSAADRVAEIIATKQAEAELSAALPPILSVGKGFE